jgi:proline iminopeptidase
MSQRIGSHDTFLVTHGSGPPLIVLHGGPGLDHTCLRPWLDALGARSKLVYYDAIGSGGSERDVDLGDGSDVWLEQLDAVRAHVGEERVRIFGHSAGGFLALEYALRYRDRVEALVLCATVPTLDYGAEIMANARSRGTPEQLAMVETLFTGHVPDDATFRSSMRVLGPLYLHRPQPKYLAALDENTRFGAAAQRHGTLRWFPKYNVLARLGEITVPTLVLAGGDDWITPAKQVARLHTGIRGSQSVVFEESGHMPFVEEHEKFVAVVGAWIAKLPSSMP